MPQQPFLALITPLTGPVDPGYGIPAPPPHVGGGPIYPPPEKPPGPPHYPAHPISGLPVDPNYGVPGPPYFPGGGDKPPGIWGGSGQPFPTPPINLPPDLGKPQPPYDPPGIWGGSGRPFPTPPIYIPPVVPPGGKPPEFPSIWPEPDPPFETVPPDKVLVPVYIPGVGWKYVAIDKDRLPPGWGSGNPMPK